jgi:hypothetical protein
MNIKQWIDDLILHLSEEVETEFIHERFYLPEAVYNESSGRITLYGNPPSLVRAGILYFLCHEVAHHEHLKRYGEVGDDYSESFLEIETELKHKMWEVYLKEHENKDRIGD